MPEDYLEKIDEAEIALFKKKLKKLKEFRGKGTELISLYMPEDADRSSVMGQITEEMSQSSNIKSPQTRKNVQGALRKIDNFLKQINFKIPKNGLVVFCGNISEQEGKSDIQLMTLRPIRPLRTKLYWCDSEFHLTPLEDMVIPKDVFGILVIDKSDATIAALIGKKYEILGRFTSGISGKHRAGGQCLDPETKIIVDNRLKELKDIKIGNKIRAFNFKKNSGEETICINKWEIEDSAVFKISFNNNNIIASKNHLFFVEENGKIIEKPAKDLIKGNKLLDKNGKTVEITEISAETLETTVKLIDIETKNHNFIANGLIVHNSAQRFERLHEEAAQEFYKRISEKINEMFLPFGEKLKGLIVAGPGMTKNYFLNKDLVDYRVKKKILGLIDTSYTDESGIREVVQRADELLKDAEIIKEKNLINKFLEAVVKDGPAAYGQKEVEESLAIGKVSMLLVSEAIEWLVFKVHCEKCGFSEEIIVKEPEKFDSSRIKCGSCKSDKQIEVLEEIDYADWLMEKAHSTGAETYIVSTETPEGEQFFKGFGGIGALLRYK